MATVDNYQPIQRIKLDPNTELRFEIKAINKKCYVTLKTGSAEVFGTDLFQDKSYEFISGAKTAIFSWEGCVLELRGIIDYRYVAKDTPMKIYKNCHNFLDQMRLSAENHNNKGPVCMVVGPCDVGKSTVVKILLNYAVRMGRTPYYIDLDLGQGQISVPGTISALSIKTPVSIEQGYLQEDPLVYQYGYTSPSENKTLFDMLLTQLGNNIKDILENDKKVKMSGVIINTCGWVKGLGYQHILQAGKAFEVDVILVVHQVALYNKLEKDVPNFVKVVFIPKSDGVVKRSPIFRIALRDQRIREYFYGTTRNPLTAYSFDIKWNDVKIFKISQPAITHSTLKLVLLTPNPNMLNHLLAVSSSNKENDLILSKCAGFVCVTNVDIKRQTLTILSSKPEPLTNKLLLLSEVQFMNRR